MKQHTILTVAASLTVLAVGVAFAQNAKLMDTALERSVPYQIARSELSTTIDRLERVKNDPLATKPEMLDAQLNVDTARANLTQTGIDVRKNFAREFYAWQEAKDALDVAKLKFQFAQTSLTAAQVRFKSGAINQIELNRAEADARSADADQDGAEADLAAAASVLRTRLGDLPAVNATLEAAPKPNKANLEANLERHPRAIEARARLERAKLDLDIKDNDFTAPVDVQNAKTAVANAQKSLNDTQSNLRTALNAAWDAFNAADKAVPVRERNAKVAQDDLAAQQARLAKGLIPRLTVLQAQITLEGAQLALGQAKHRRDLSVMDLALAANMDLWAK